MANLNDLRKEIEFFQNFGDNIEVFKSAAIMQFSLYSQRKVFISSYRDSLIDALRLAHASGLSEHACFQSHTTKERAVLAVTSDEGFLGELNTLIVNKVFAAGKGKATTYDVIGSRGASAFDDARVTYAYCGALATDAVYPFAMTVADTVCRHFFSEGKETVVVFPHFVSLGAQHITEETLLPFSVTETATTPRDRASAVLLEPSPEHAAAALGKLWVTHRIANILIDTKLAELAARIMHLEESSNQLTEMRNKLRLSFFKEVHAVNDKSIREISAAKLMVRT